MITQEYLKECVFYNMDTGIFTWKTRPVSHFKNEGSQKTWNKRFANKECGKRLISAGKFYKQLTLNYKRYTQHRLAFLYVNGAMPENEIDHINGNGEDNSFSNLRDVSRGENNKNLRLQKNSSTGICGVSFDKRSNKYRATITVDYKHISLGYFDELLKAKEAREKANFHYGFHKNHGEFRDAFGKGDFPYVR